MKAVVVAFALLLVSCQGLHFFLKEGTPRCFTDDIPSGSPMQIHWHFIDQLPGVKDDSQTDGVMIEVYGPDNTLLKSWLTTRVRATKTEGALGNAEAKGKYTLTTEKGGQHKVCVKTTTSHVWKENQKIRYGMRLVVGEQEEIQDALQEQHIQGLSQKIKIVSAKARDFTKFQDLTRSQEDELLQSNIAINDRVVFFTIVQTVVILLSGVYQIVSLRRFFKAKNLY